VVAASLQHFTQRRLVVDELATFLATPTRAYSPYLVTWLLAAMLEHPGRMPEAWVAQAAKRVKDRNEATFLRAVAAVVMLRGGRASDIVWIKRDIMREHDPFVLRGYTVGLHWAGELDRGVQNQLTARSAALVPTVEYLRGRRVLPSLVFRDTILRIP
jgi:hypothetical protein